MSDYEWDGWLDEKLVVFGVNRQKKKGKEKGARGRYPSFSVLVFSVRSSSEIDRE